MDRVALFAIQITAFLVALVALDSAYTTQDCFRCGTRVKKELWERTHICPSCGYTVNRDLNAAFNIRERAFSVGWGTPESTLMETRSSVQVNELE